MTCGKKEIYISLFIAYITVALKDKANTREKAEILRGMHSKYKTVQIPKHIQEWSTNITGNTQNLEKQQISKRIQIEKTHAIRIATLEELRGAAGSNTLRLNTQQY